MKCAGSARLPSTGRTQGGSARPAGSARPSPAPLQRGRRMRRLAVWWPSARLGEVMVRAPQTRFTRSPGGRIAFQVMGEGPCDLVVVGGPASHLDLQWEDPGWVLGRQRLASFARVVHFDRRGTGLSDP